MRIEIRMPRLSDAMTEGTLTSWFKSEGDAVKEGEAIAELETEKSTVDLEAPASGVLARIVVPAGETAVAVGALLAEIDTEAAPGKSTEASSTASTRATQGSAGSAPAPAAASSAQASPSAVAPSAVSAAPAPEATAVEQERAPSSPPRDDEVPATPLARRMADQAGLDLASLSRTGIGGKVCKADVESALGATARPQVPAPADAHRGAAVTTPRAAGASTRTAAPPLHDGSDTTVPLSRVRRTVAARMASSKSTIPHFYLAVDCRVDRLLDVRARLKADGVAVSVNDFVVRAAALALRRVPEANASFREGAGASGAALVLHGRVDIAVAVALDDGLVTPVLRAVDTLGLGAIADATREVASRAREGRLAPHEYDGATFTVSNLGMFGVDEMYAIVNPPQACILGVGAAEPRALVEDGVVVAGTAMTLTLSADHRVLDGATGARFLGEVRRLLEEPARMLL